MNAPILSGSDERLRQGFKYVNRFMLTLFRLGLGEWLNSSPSTGGRIMVLTHTGRKTGAKHRTPVNYAIVNGEIYCTAGFGRISDWYRNLKKNPQVEVWLPDGWWGGVAQDISDSPNRISLLREVIIASGFAGRAAGLDPVNMSDAELDAATRDYALIHIQRTEARTGPGGPGDLAWVWPASTFFLLAMLFTRRKR
ncbi:MAG: nitroreductase family deazaflavin-dependent oxidoreductase [Anaerolineae bacterium]